VTTSQIDTSLAAGITLTSASYTSPLTITSHGTISDPGIVSDYNWTIQNAGSVSGNDNGILFSGAGGSIGNTGTITGGNFGIFFTDAYLAATVDNAGYIQGAGGVAPFAAGLYGGGDFINEASGTAAGNSFGVVIRGASGTIDNSGTISGSTQAVFMGAASSLLIDHAGAVFSGYVVADTHDTTAVIELASGASAGTLIGIGTQFTGFGTIAIDSGARWGIGRINASLTIDNSGTVSGASDGLYLTAGGSVTNAMGASIGGRSGDGVRIAGASGTVDNSGTITGTGPFSVYLADGGSITNRTNGLLSGANFGAYIKGATGTIDNSGSIVGSINDAAYLYSGGSVINESTGSIGGSRYGVNAFGSSVTVENAGTISGGVDAVNLGGTGTNRLLVDPGATFTGGVVANPTAADTLELKAGGSGAISGIGSQYRNFQTVTIDSSATWSIGNISVATTIENAGTIMGATDGLYLAAGGSVTNETGGSISGSRYGINFTGNFSATVKNAGTITGMGAGGAGVYLKDGGSVTNAGTGSIGGGANGLRIRNAAATVDNSGTITGTSNAGVYLTDAGSVTNETGGSIGGGVNGVYMTTTPGSVVNSGTITGTSTDGVRLDDGGSVTNETGALISGGATGVYMLGAAGTIDNSGTIAGTSAGGIRFLKGGSVTNETTGSISGGADGVYVRGGAGTIDNLGKIAGGSGNGVYLFSGGSVTNESTGSIGGGRYGVEIYGTSATVENAGTISGGVDALDLSGTGTNRLIVDPGAKFTGEIFARATAANTLELTSGAAAGTISGLGTQYQNFQTVTIDSGAAWTVGGTEAGFSGTAVDGFNSHDRLDLTNLTFNAGDTATVSGGNKLVIADAGGNVTIQMDGAVTGDLFKLVSDGHTGTFLEETNYTPCFLRGTQILTAKGQVRVEDLRIGDMVMTLTGQSLPLKWVGRRGYSDWLAVGNAEVQPILFKAGSIADHVPARDLYVSPEHAMFLDGLLIPARLLVNGVSILKIEGMEDVAYFHLEFDRHVVILAEGAAAESFVDDDSRMLFHNADEYRRLYPDEPPRREAEFCAPRVEAGAALDRQHRTLATRAARLLPDGTATEALARLGYLDRATRTFVEGWAFAGIGEGPVRLSILVNGAVVGRTVADRYRADLGFGDEPCGFRFTLPHDLSPQVNHLIEVRRESDWSLLQDGRVALNPTTRRGK
jgi:hypothetical protein